MAQRARGGIWMKGVQADDQIHEREESMSAERDIAA